jgi:hypothetical protein
MTALSRVPAGWYWEVKNSHSSMIWVKKCYLRRSNNIVLEERTFIFVSFREWIRLFLNR